MTPDKLPAQPNIMIVDDTPVNLRLLDEMLRDRGYRVRSFPRGRLALAAATNEPPDLILLDINMPEMTGYQVCEHLKNDQQLADIPVIFLSALNETLDKVRAFGCGGVDYITKPFQFEEVHARIETQLKLRKLQRNLSEQNRELMEICTRLREMETLRDNLVHMVVHDLRAPLTAQMVSLDFLISSALAKLNETEKVCAENALHGGTQLSAMIDTLLDVSRLESGKMPLTQCPANLCTIAKTVTETLQSLLGKRHLALTATEDPLFALCDAALVQRILTNLIDNAIRHTEPQGTLRLEISRVNGFPHIAVTNDGPGIPAEFHEKIFQKFGQVNKQQKHTTGLGLTFCRLAVEAHGGRIGITSEPGEGCTFWFTLPEC